MPAKKAIQKFCNLITYYEIIDPDIFDVIRRFCLVKLFMVRKDADGITLIIPNKETRQKILNAAYSSDPEEAIELIKALILVGFYGNADDFKEGAVNILKRKIEVEDVDAKEEKVFLKNGLSLVKDKRFKPLAFRGKINMAVWVMSGKNVFSPEGPKAEPLMRRAEVVGGRSEFDIPYKASLLRLIENEYVNSRLIRDNVYVQKVCLQLRALQVKGVDIEELKLYLGNDEISDSYLLDMYCSTYHKDVFRSLYEIFTKNRNELQKANFNKYIGLREDLLGTEQHNKLVKRDPTWFSGIENSIDILSKVKNLYGKRKRELARDLFIIFCNTAKEAWIHDSKENKMAVRYSLFLEMANYFYTTHDSMLKYPFPPNAIISIHGNLLKSDVMLFQPQARFDRPEDTNIPILNEIPVPVELKQYSISYLINQVPTWVQGGGRHDDEINKILAGL